MSLSPVQMSLQIRSLESSVASRRPSPASGPATAPSGESTAETSTPEPALPPSAQFSTDMRVDDQHQLYYEFVDDSTGNVLFEIPPEALRAIGESLDVPLDGHSSGNSLDVKS